MEEEDASVTGRHRGAYGGAGTSSKIRGFRQLQSNEHELPDKDEYFHRRRLHGHERVARTTPWSCALPGTPASFAV